MKINIPLFIVGLVISVILTVGFFLMNPSKKTMQQKEASEQETQYVSEVEDYKNWRFECKEGKDLAGQETQTCHIFQRLTWDIELPDGKTAQKDALTILVRLLDNENKDATNSNIRLLTPLGLDLSKGIAMKVDDGKEFRLPLQICIAAGCQVDFFVGQDVLDLMLSGKMMHFSYNPFPATEENALKIDASLDGFKKAHKILEKKTSL